jgi:hypothetical protein
MNRDDIIRMALEAGFRIDGNEVTESDGYLIQTELLTDFAELVAAAEREACAKACEAYDSADPLNVSGECAERIRLRGRR